MPPQPITLATILATVLGFAIFLFCAWHALYQWWAGEGPRGLAILFLAGLFGLIVEYVNMKVFITYYYGPFPFMIFGTVPLMIVLSWGAIVYGAMRTSDHMKLVWWLRPVYDGLLGITIDLALDPVAIKLGYWTWISAFEQPYWFNIPFGNYYGWYMVVFWYSLVARILFLFTPSSWLGAWRDVAIPAITVVLALVPFYLSLLVYGYLIMPPPNGLGIFEPTVFAIIMGANLLVGLRVSPRPRTTRRLTGERSRRRCFSSRLSW